MIVAICVAPTAHAYAQCVSDVYSLTLAPKMLSYDAEEGMQLASKSALDIRGERIFICPNRNLEFRPYIGITHVSLDGDDTKNMSDSINKSQTMPFIGLYMTWLRSQRWEWSARLHIEENILLSLEWDDDNFNEFLDLHKERFSQIMIGPTWNFWQSHDSQLSLSFHAGLFLPLSETDQLGAGPAISPGLHYLKRQQRSSWKASLLGRFYDYTYRDEKLLRDEITLELSYIFRF